MNVGIDVSGLFWKYRTGVQVLYYGLLEGLQQLAMQDDTKFTFVDLSGQPGHSLPVGESGRFELRGEIPLAFLPSCSDMTLQPFKAAGNVWNSGVRFLRKRLTRHPGYVNRMMADLDVLQVWNWDIRTARGAAHVINIPDVIPLIYPELFERKFIEATQTSLDFAKDRADQVLTISEYTKRDLVEKAGIPESKITVVYPGIRQVFRPVDDRPAIETVLEKYGLKDRPYVLSIGFLDPRKNVKGHVQAFARLTEDKRYQDFHLALVGPPSLATSQVLQQIQSAEARERVHITGFVPDDELVLLLNGARLFTYCSLYEGFGFPVVEAMSCGVPVVTSNSTSLKEVGSDAAILVDPEDSEQIADAMKRVLGDTSLASDLKARGLVHARQFTWEKWAMGHLEAYRRC